MAVSHAAPVYTYATLKIQISHMWVIKSSRKCLIYQHNNGSTCSELPLPLGSVKVF